MRYSCFSSFGLLRFSSKPSVARKIYDAQKKNYGSGFDFTIGTHAEARLYASAMGLGRAAAAIERAGSATDYGKIYELIPVAEKDWGAKPGATATIAERRTGLQRQYRINRGSRPESLDDELATLLGDDFIAVRAVAPDEAVSNIDDGPYNFTRIELEPKIVTLAEPVGTLGVPLTVAYSYDDNLPAVLIQKGDVLTVQPENTGLAEVVTVTGATSSSLTATFTKAHDAFCYATTGHWPNLWSTQRFLYVVVTEEAAADFETRRKIHELMHRLVRATTQWAIVEEPLIGALIGPFTVGVSPIGSTPIGTLTL